MKSETADANPHGEPDPTSGGLLTCTVTIALAGLLFGFDTAVISGTTDLISAAFDLDPTWLGITVSSALWGTLAGALLAGRPGDAYGSRDVLRVIAVLYIVSAVGCAIAWDWWSFVAFRVIGGVAVGGASVLAPVYISEVAPTSRRGRLVMAFQTMVVVGILVAYLSNAVIAGLGLGDIEWRWKFGVAAAPAIVFLLLLLRIPQSPRWLMKQDARAEARSSLDYIGLTEDQAAWELDEIATSLQEQDERSRTLSPTRHRKPIVLAILVAGFSQFSGINAMLYYANDIFSAAGTDLSANLQAIVIGAVNCIFTFVGLALIDRLGRRTLLLSGSAGMAAALVVAGLALNGLLPGIYVLIALVVFIMFFASGTGAVIWVYISEVFPTPVRGRGSSVGASAHWAANALISAVFPAVAAVSQGLPFFFFAAMMVAQFFIVMTYFPETKGVPLERMERKLGVKFDAAEA